MLLKLPSKIFVVFILILYLAFAIAGCFFLEEGLRPQNLVMPTHHAYKYLDYMEKYFWPKGIQLEVVVNNAQNLTLKSQRDRILQIVDEFQSTPHTMGPVATDFM